MTGSMIEWCRNVVNQTKVPVKRNVGCQNRAGEDDRNEGRDHQQDHRCCDRIQLGAPVSCYRFVDGRDA